MNMGNRQQLLSILAIAVVVLWVGDKILIEPLLKSWKARSEQLARLRTDYANGSRRLAWEQTIRSDWNRMRTNALSADRSVAENQVLTAFARWSRDSGVTVTSVRPQPKPASTNHMTLECTVDAAGTLAGLTRFLYMVESDPLALKVDGVRINSRDNTGRQLELSLQVSGLILISQRR